MTSAKKRIRDTFYMEMYEVYQLSKDQVVEILKGAGFDMAKFDIKELIKYEQTVINVSKLESIKKRMIPFKHDPCPYPGCKGEKINFKVGGKSLWKCSKGKENHRLVLRAARLKAKMDERNHKADPKTFDKRVLDFIKEYESYVEQQAKNG